MPAATPTCRRPLPRPLPSRHGRAQRRGFSLLEIILTLSLMTILLGWGAHLSGNYLQAQQLRRQAEKLTRMFAEARDLAVRRGTPVRVAFHQPPRGTKPEEWERNNSVKRPPRPAAALFVFEIPEDLSQVTRVTSPTAAVEGGVAENSTRTEWVPQAGGPLPEAFVGRWVLSAGDRQWVRFDGQVQLTGSLFNEFERENYEEFVTNNFWTPPALWGEPAEATGTEPARHYSTPYPEEYFTLPHPTYPAPPAAPLGEQEEIPSISTTQQAQNAAEVLGTRPYRHFPLRLRQQEREELEVPAVEFRPDGSVAATWTKRMRFRLSPVGRMNPMVEILLECRDGRAEILEPGDTRTTGGGTGRR